MLTKKTKEVLFRKISQKQIEKICAELFEKQSAMPKEEFLEIMRKHKVPLQALDHMQQGSGRYVWTQTWVYLATRGVEAAKGKFSKSRK